MSVSPTALIFCFPMKNKGRPIPMMGRAMAEMLNFPIQATSHAVTVVPRLAPMITPIAAVRVSRPAFTKLTTRTVVAEEDCTSEVVKKPVKTELARLYVMVASALRMPLPAAF